MSKPKVMISLTTHPQPPYIYPACWQSIKDLRWSGQYEMVMVWDKFDKVLGGDEKVTNYSQKYVKIRDMFLASDCEALLTLESDHIYPPDALEKMIQVQADIVYGLYCSRPNGNHVWMLRRGEKIGMAGVIDKATMISVWNQVVPSDGLGTGCTLIYRRVLEQLPFRWSAGLGHDWYLAKDAKAAGFTQMHDCRVHIGHLLDQRRSVWPDPNKTYKLRIARR